MFWKTHWNHQSLIHTQRLHSNEPNILLLTLLYSCPERLVPVLQAAGIDVQPGTAWTILAPTNFAFADRLNKTFGITPADLLLPESRDTLTAVRETPALHSCGIATAGCQSE